MLAIAASEASRHRTVVNDRAFLKLEGEKKERERVKDKMVPELFGRTANQNGKYLD